MNILILAAGAAEFNTHDGNYPLCLAEIDGSPLIEHLFHSCKKLLHPKFIVALRKEEIRHFHLDNIISILAPGAALLSINAGTRGAACTALLAADKIDTDEELLILNGNELLALDFQAVLADFKKRKLNAGIVTFPSVHPRYSYVRLNESGHVIEAAEKNPISRHATVGFYWFAKGTDFVTAVKHMIRKDASVNELFYICPALNEMVLTQARIGTYEIEASQYHPLKTERQWQQFETVQRA